MLFVSAYDATIVKNDRNDRTMAIIHFHKRITIEPDDVTESIIMASIYL